VDPAVFTTPFARLVEPSPEELRRFAEDHYEVPVDLDAVRHVHALRPLTQAVVTALDADLTMKDLAGTLAASRYPSATG
jgi:hypothetical protein